MATLEYRISELAAAQAVSEARVTDLANQVQQLTPMTTQIVEVRASVREVQKEVAGVGRQVEKVDKGIADREREQREDRRSIKIALYGLTTSIIASGVGAVVVAVVKP